MVRRVAVLAFVIGLLACADAQASRAPHVACWPHLSGWHERQRPHTCNLRVARRNSFYKLRNMHWDRWNNDSAHGRGRVLKQGGGSYAVRVEAWRPRPGWPHHKPYYSKAWLGIGSHNIPFRLAVPHRNHF